MTDEDDRDLIRITLPEQPMTKEELELLSSGLIRRRLMTREEIEKEFPGIKTPQRD